MITVTSFNDFGYQDHGWLKAAYHFSFADYYDPERLGFGVLRVWNDDWIQAGSGFGMHPHKDMEIMTYVRQGEISHEDSLGNQGSTKAGQVQVMSAGTGIRHSEYNLNDEDVTLFQIWVEPDALGHTPRWDTRTLDDVKLSAGFQDLVSGRHGQEHDGQVFIHQDVALKAAVMAPGENISVELESGRCAYVVTARGKIKINGVHLSARGAATIRDETHLSIEALSEAEVVMLDLP